MEGCLKKKGLAFERGAYFYISCWRNEDMKRLVSGIQSSPAMFGGLEVLELSIEENSDLSRRTHFKLGSPVYIQRNVEGGRKRFYFYNDKEAGGLLKETLLSKMQKAGLEADQSLRISFDLDYHKKKIKKLDYKKGQMISQIKASWCPVFIEGETLTKQFAWCVGLGNSTGIGFGAIK